MRLFAIAVSVLVLLTHGPEVRATEKVEFRFPQYVPNNLIDKQHPLAFTVGEMIEIDGRQQREMLINGRRTGFHAITNPMVMRVSDNFYFVHDQHGGTHASLIWSMATEKALDMGTCFVQSVGGLGMATLRRLPDEGGDKRMFDWELLQFDPKTGEPRRIWKTEHSSTIRPILLGHSEGRIVLVQGKQLHVFGRGKPKKFEVEQDGMFWQHGGDAVRGKYVLMRGQHTGIGPQVWSKPYRVPVAVFDLETGETKAVGEVRGSWTAHTAVPHPHVHVAWITKEEAKRQREGKDEQRKLIFTGLGFGPTGYVIAETLRTWPDIPDPMPANAVRLSLPR